MNTRSLSLGTAAITATAAILTVGVVVSAGSDHHNTTQTTARACRTALGVPATATTTVSDLGGPRAAAVLGHPHVTGKAATNLLDTLYQISNWRDLDPATVTRWVYHPSRDNLPAAAHIDASALSASLTGRGYYEARCAAILATLTGAQTARAAATPHIDTTPTREGLRAATAAQSLLGQPNTAHQFVAALLGAAYPHDDQHRDLSLAHVIWRGTRVAPAAATRGDLIAFDYNHAGPTQLAVMLNTTTVAATTGLDTPANPGAVVTGHPPTVNTAVIRLDTPATATEGPTQP